MALVYRILSDRQTDSGRVVTAAVIDRDNRRRRPDVIIRQAVFYPTSQDIMSEAISLLDKESVL